MPDFTRLKSLAAQPIAELRSRANALPELLAELNRVIAAAENEHRESSAEMASLAGTVLNAEIASTKTVPADRFNALVASAHSLAGSVMAQFEPEAASDGSVELPLPLDEASARALRDAQDHGQALPLERTTILGPDTTGPVGIDKEA